MVEIRVLYKVRVGKRILHLTMLEIKQLQDEISKIIRSFVETGMEEVAHE